MAVAERRAFRRPIGVGRRGSAKVTLSDVATLAGVSVTTASFVLSGRRDMRISEGTQERVHQAARELSYVPRNPMGASLPVRAPSIGFISDTVGTEPFAGELIRGCVTAATEHGHSLLMTETEGLRTLEVSESRELVDRGVGQFLYASMAMRVTTLPPNLRGKPVFMLNCIDRRRSVPSVIPDDLAAGRRAAAELVDAGHGDRIMLVGEVATMVYPGRQRLDGIQQMLAESGHALLGHLSCRWWPQDARTAVLRRLGHPTAERPTAMIALNDRVAMGSTRRPSRSGWRSHRTCPWCHSTTRTSRASSTRACPAWPSRTTRWAAGPSTSCSTAPPTTASSGGPEDWPGSSILG